METLNNNLVDAQDILYTPESIISACLRNLNGIRQMRQCIKVKGTYTSPSQTQGTAFAQLIGDNMNMPLRLYFSTREGNMQMFSLLIPGNEYIFTGIISYFVNKDTLSLQLTPIEAKNSADNNKMVSQFGMALSDVVKACIREKKIRGVSYIEEVINECIIQRNKLLALLIRPMSDTAERDMKAQLGNMTEYCKIIPHECDFTKPNDIASLLLKADMTSCDIIILSRGGGENLWIVDNKEVLEALSRIKKPIITGLGLEKDHLIADYLADKVCSVPAMVGVYLRDTIQRLKKEKEKREEVRLSESEKKYEPGPTCYNKHSKDSKTFYGIKWTEIQPIKWLIFLLCIIGIIQVITIFL